MKSKIFTVASIFIFCLSGCIGKVSEESKNTTMSCIDFRDNETFTIHGGNISNIIITVTDRCFDAVDNSGTKRTMCKSMEQFIKCKEIKTYLANGVTK